MKTKRLLLPLFCYVLGGAFADQPEKAYLDAILERDGPPSPGQIDDLDLTGPGGVPDGQIDVRDLAIFFDGLPVSATFGRAESIAFASDGSVTLPIYFSKPVQGTIRFDLGGSALTSVPERDITLLQNEITLWDPTTFTQIGISIRPWRGFGGEKVVRISLAQDPDFIPAAGTFPSHLLRLRQFDAGEFVGLLTFPPASGLPVLPVRVGLNSDGQATCSFQDSSSLLGETADFTWNPGFLGFPNFLGTVPVVIPKETFGRDTDITASFTLQRMAQPYPEDLQAYVDGFPEDDQPAVYHADLVIPDLFAAGAANGGANEHAIIYQGRLVLQPVDYADEEP